MKEEASLLKEVKKYRPYNRRRMIDWLESFAGTTRTRRNAEPIRRIDKRDKPGPQTPPGLGAARQEAMLDPDVRATDNILSRVFLTELPNRSFTWYLNLFAPYLGPDASPSVVERWDRLAGGGEDAKKRFDMHDEALEWAIGRAEELLAERGRKRLIVLDPQAPAREVEQTVESKRRKAADTFYEMLDDCEREGFSGREVVSEAVRRTCQKTGYSERELRTIRQSMGRREP